MNRCTFNVKKGIIVAWILLLSVWWAHAQNVGDLRTNRSPARTGTVGDWQIRTGPGSDDWATATGNITALLAAAGKITMNHAILADLSCVVNGEIVNPNSSTMTVATTAVFTLVKPKRKVFELQSGGKPRRSLYKQRHNDICDT